MFVALRHVARCANGRNGILMKSAILPPQSRVTGCRVVHSKSSPDFERIGLDYVVEEETLPRYNAESYYPVRLGQVFDERYKTIGKLGFGTASTVWLCRDLRTEDRYVAVKVFVNSARYHRELPIYEEIRTLRSDHEGQRFVRKLYDSFEIDGPHGKHICLVHQPMGMSLQVLKEVTPDGLYSPELLRQTLRCILLGLQFLHKELQVIHTDLQASNMLVGIHDHSVLTRFEQYECENPCPRKEMEDRTIYLSRPMPFCKGPPSITDLSEARFGNTKHTDWIMPNVYRAPEVILGIPWSYPVDIWGFAMVLWDLFHSKRLFPTEDDKGYYSEAHHLASMIAIMGHPPRELLQQSELKSKKYWDENGQWTNLAPIPNISLETEEQRLEGADKHQFLVFMRKMLQWDPEARGDCEDVYWDEWLLADLIERGEVVRDE